MSSLRLYLPGLFSIGIIILSYPFLKFLILSMDSRQFVKQQALSLENRYKISEEHDTLKMSSKLNNIFWYLQVTDIHISKYKDSGRTSDLRRLCEVNIPAISPEFVLISGDLTDAKSWTAQDSMQYKEEWEAYQHTLRDTGVLTKTKWIDLRGNHDSFNVPYLQHPNNFFREYSVMGQKHSQSYMYTHRKSFGTYSIIAIDACPDPGLKRPYNFVGVLKSNGMQQLQHFNHAADKANLTVWFGHYPTSTIIAPGYDLRSLIGMNGVAYLSGHLHTIYNFVPRMYTLQPQGFLELELGDWKETRIYRLLAVDHDLLSFADVNLHQWPIILITNPKNSNFLVPSKEPVHRISQSSHIRLLAFSNVSIISVHVYIDSILLGQAQSAMPSNTGSSKKSLGGLYTLPWDVSKYLHDNSEHQHRIKVVVLDADGREAQVEQFFSVTGTPLWQFDYVASCILLGDVELFARRIYYTTLFFCLIPVLFMRFVKYKIAVFYPVFRIPMSHLLYKFAQKDSLFFPWIIYFLWTSSLPLMMGKIVDDHWGIVFVFGVYIKETFIPEALTYQTECVQNVLFMFPFLTFLCFQIHRHDAKRRPSDNDHETTGHNLHVSNGYTSGCLITNSTHHSDHCSKFHTYAKCVLSMALQLASNYGLYVLLIWQLYLTILTVYLPYGITCFVFSCRTWLIVMAYWMHQSVYRHAGTFVTVPCH